MQMPVAVILAGGVNSRFWPLREKSLLWFCGESLLARQVRLFAAAGVTNCMVVGNPANSRLLKEGMIAAGRGDIPIVEQPDARGMGDALLQARPVLRERFPGRPVLICQVHDVTEASLITSLLRAGDGNAAGWLVGQEVHRYFPGGYLGLDGERITGIVEKPVPGSEPSNVVNLVMHLFADAEMLCNAVADVYAGDIGTTHDDHYERGLTTLIKHERLEVVRYGGRWQPIKYPWHVLDVGEMLLRHIDAPRIADDARVADGAGIEGNVVVERGVRLLAGARVVGPAYIGAGSTICNNALVRDAIIGPHCVIGYNTDVARSYIGGGTWFHKNYVGDSVIGDGTKFGAGTITGNLKMSDRTVRSMVKGELIDTGRDKLGVICGKRARTGINVSLMPGVKVGERSGVGPGVVLLDDLPDDTRVILKQELTYQRRPIRGEG